MAKKKFGSYGVSLLLHGVLLALLVVSIHTRPAAVRSAGPTEAQPIRAVAVNAADVQAEVRRLRAEQHQQAHEDAARRRQVKEETARLAALKRQREADEAKAQRQLAQLKQEQEAVAQKRAAEQKRLEQLAAQRKMAQEQAQKAEQARIKRQAAQDLKRQLAAEAQRLQKEQQAAQTRANARYVAQYKDEIEAQVQSNWLRPPETTQDFTCTVLVQQMPTGDVLSVQITKSCGSPVLDRSVENAVRKSSPLPPPPVPEVFDREIEFTFSSSSQ